MNRRVVVSFFVAFFVMVGLASTAIAQASQDAVLILHFDEGSGRIVKDESGYGNNGTIYGAKWVDGKSGKALEFDTGDGIYPSIMGTHKGEIKPSDNINVSKLYTYPCAGTGGHTKSIELEENGIPLATGTCNGYLDDYHTITIHTLP